MTVINGKALLEASPIVGMVPEKVRFAGVSFGLAEVGYDIRIKQEILFKHDTRGNQLISVRQEPHLAWVTRQGRFTIASAIELFAMPSNLAGIVHDKSTWARRGLSVFNTVIEPGWNGYLTLELVYHGPDPLHIPAGAGIAQVIFHEVAQPATYSGKYQNQPDRPVEALAD